MGRKSNMANKGLIVIGIIIIIGVFYLTNIYLTPQQIQQIELANYVCNLEVMDIPLGALGRAISPDAANECEKVEMIMPVIKYRLYLYGLGILLIIIGVAIGNKQIVKEVVHITHHEEKKEPVKKEEEKTVTKARFCRKCGTKLKPGTKFCNKCGNKT